MGPVAYAINLFTMRLQMVVMPIDLRDLSRTVVARTTSVHLHILMEFDEAERNKEKKILIYKKIPEKNKTTDRWKNINWENKLKSI